jgi:hypothetical protein
MAPNMSAKLAGLLKNSVTCGSGSLAESTERAKAVLNAVAVRPALVPGDGAAIHRQVCQMKFAMLLPFLLPLEELEASETIAGRHPQIQLGFFPATVMDMALSVVEIAIP